MIWRTRRAEEVGSDGDRGEGMGEGEERMGVGGGGDCKRIRSGTRLIGRFKDGGRPGRYSTVFVYIFISSVTVVLTTTCDSQFIHSTYPGPTHTVHTVPCTYPL